jgi:hypothetical protein
MALRRGPATAKCTAQGGASARAGSILSGGTACWLPCTGCPMKTLRIPAGSSVFFGVSVKSEQFESEISYVDPPTKKERLLLSGLEQATGVTAEDVEDEHDEDEDFDDGDDEKEQP